jgi:uncharacterized membrane protein
VTPGRARLLRRRLVAGLVVIAPVSITALILWWIFQWLDGLLGRFLYPALGFTIPGLGLLLLLLILFLAGWATERAVGARLLQSWHAVLERFPLTSKLYGASHRIVRTVLGKDRSFFREVVCFEYPSPGRWAIGFVTAPVPGEVRTHIGDAVSVFVPTSPNPTSGFLIMVPAERVIRLSMSVEEGFTYILSAGAVTPDMQRVIPPPPIRHGPP